MSRLEKGCIAVVLISALVGLGVGCYQTNKDEAAKVYQIVIIDGQERVLNTTSAGQVRVGLRDRGALDITWQDEAGRLHRHLMPASAHLHIAEIQIAGATVETGQ